MALVDKEFFGFVDGKWLVLVGWFILFMSGIKSGDLDLVWGEEVDER